MTCLLLLAYFSNSKICVILASLSKHSNHTFLKILHYFYDCYF